MYTNNNNSTQLSRQLDIIKYKVKNAKIKL